MAKIGSYCKAYPVERFREFSGWVEKSAPPAAKTTIAGVPEGDGTEPADEVGYFFLQEDLTVTRDVYQDGDIVYDDVNEAWQEFCHVQLCFEIPEYARPDKEES